MARKREKGLKAETIIYALIALVVILYYRSGGKVIDVTSDFNLEAYRDLITTEGDFHYMGVPLHIWLARNTKDYNAVKSAYNSTYGGNFTEELTSRLAGQKLADYVAELLKNGQVITP